MNEAPEVWLPGEKIGAAKTHFLTARTVSTQTDQFSEGVRANPKENLNARPAGR